MRRRTLVVVGILWALSLVIVATVAYAQARAYTRLPEPRIFTGADVGFRLEGMHGEMPTGNLVIRVNGEWIEAKVGAPSIVR